VLKDIHTLSPNMAAFMAGAVGSALVGEGVHALMHHYELGADDGEPDDNVAPEIVPAEPVLAGMDVGDVSDVESDTSTQEAERRANAFILPGEDVLGVNDTDSSSNLNLFASSLAEMGDSETIQWKDKYFNALYFRSSDMCYPMSRIYETARTLRFDGRQLMSPEYIKVLNLLQYHRNSSRAHTAMMEDHQIGGLGGMVLPFTVDDAQGFKDGFIGYMERIFGKISKQLSGGLFGTLDSTISLKGHTQSESYSTVSRDVVDFDSYTASLQRNGLYDIAIRIEALYRAFRGNQLKVSTQPKSLFRLVKKKVEDKGKSKTIDVYEPIEKLYVEIAVDTDPQKDFKPEDVGKLVSKWREIDIGDYMILSGASEYVEPRDALSRINEVVISEDNEWLHVLDNVNIFIGAGLDPTAYMNTLPYPRGCAIFAIVRHWIDLMGASLTARMIDDMFIN
jgi:hypothetical protein